MLALSFNSCSKDDGDGDNVEYNKFTINNNTYELTSGFMEYYGYDNDHNDLKNAASIMIYIGYNSWEEVENAFDRGEAAGVEITVNVPKTSTKLVAGTYPFNPNSGIAFNCIGGFADEGEDDHKFTEGIVTVSVSGDIYTIKVDCTLDNGGAVKGTYKGTLNWFDETLD